MIFNHQQREISLFKGKAMRMTKKTLTIVATSGMILFANSTLFSQSKTAYTEFGGGIGTLNCSGNIATTTSTEALIREVRPQIKVMAKRQLNDWFGLGIETSYGWLSADDANHSNHKRKLSTTVEVLQVNAFSEIQFIRFGKYHFENKFALYIKLGGGLLAYNPELVVPGVFPQGYKPALNAYTDFNYFLGMGVKFRTAYRGMLGTEITVHNAGNDQLEGIYSETMKSSNNVYGGIYIYYSYLIF